MAVDKFKQTPSPTSGKPMPPDSFSQTPPRDGSMPFGGGPDAGKASPGGVPGRVQKNSSTENMQSRKDLGRGGRGVKARKRDNIPSKVDKNFRQTP